MTGGPDARLPDQLDLHSPEGASWFRLVQSIAGQPDDDPLLANPLVAQQVAASLTDAFLLATLTDDPSATAEDGLAWIEWTRDALALPGLASFGFGPDQAAEAVAKAARASSMQGNPVVLSTEELTRIYLAAL